MKCVMIFLVLTLVVLMAEPGEGFFRHLFRGAKAIFRGARQGWRAHKVVSRYRNRDVPETDNNQEEPYNQR
uniref:Class II piscidin 4 n=3 Tax=Morone TaxID=34815 RepID=A0A1L6BRP8_MORSA|nr:piscidin-4 precursor [Morone chrysops x Morone saxatilis]APQ32049.1 class II piscidin 4 [Morone saxatilis]